MTMVDFAKGEGSSFIGESDSSVGKGVSSVDGR